MRQSQFGKVRMPKMITFSLTQMESNSSAESSEVA